MDDKDLAVLLLLVLIILGICYMAIYIFDYAKHSSGMVIANEETKRKIIKMYKEGDYVVLDQHLHHYQFKVEDTFYILGIVSIVSLMNELEE